MKLRSGYIATPNSKNAHVFATPKCLPFNSRSIPELLHAARLVVEIQFPKSKISDLTTVILLRPPDFVTKLKAQGKKINGQRTQDRGIRTLPSRTCLRRFVPSAPLHAKLRARGRHFAISSTFAHSIARACIGIRSSESSWWRARAIECANVSGNVTGYVLSLQTSKQSCRCSVCQRLSPR